MGAGYSGLETVAALKPAYLKIDIALVRDVHQKKISQQVVKAILDMGAGPRRDGDRRGHPDAGGGRTRCASSASSWGQGYFYARPVDPYAERQPAVARAS